MKEILSTILAIVGCVVGSGFISGKEIVVFFSRFSVFSFLGIFVAFFLFWGLFTLVLFSGQKASLRLKQSKLSFILNISICIIFSSAMFAGSKNLIKLDNLFVKILIFCLIIIFCIIIYKKGVTFLNKINSFLVPVMIVIFLLILIDKINIEQINFKPTAFGGASVLYALLYSVLNVSNSCVLINELGSKLDSKQKARVSFLSALVLMLILLIANIVLLTSSSLKEEMPLLSLTLGSQRTTMNIVIFIGCITTLFSLIYTSSFSMRGLCNNEFLIFFVSIIVPLILSLLGFGFIVTYLYPVASIMGIFLLLDLFFIPFFKRTDDKIHSSSKNTE